MDEDELAAFYLYLNTRYGSVSRFLAGCRRATQLREMGVETFRSYRPLRTMIVN